MNKIKTKNDEKDSLCLKNLMEMMQKLFKRTARGGVKVKYSKPIKISKKLSEKGFFNRKVTIKLLVVENKDNNIEEIIRFGMITKGAIEKIDKSAKELEQFLSKEDKAENSDKSNLT